MHERPILFSAPMVRAILEGRKTQTRRVVKPAPPKHDVTVYARPTPSRGEELIIEEHTGLDRGKLVRRCPYGAPGDRLWVRETWRSDAPQRVAYQADGWCGARCPDPDADDGRWFSIQHGWLVKYSKAEEGRFFGETAYGDRWRPSIHMPRWASRLTLEVTGVRVERLQDISEEDAIAEGVEPLFDEDALRRHPEIAAHYAGKPMSFRNYLWHGNAAAPQRERDAWEYQFSGYASARDSFSSVWQMINGSRAPWASNPWVWVVEFRRVT